MTFEELLPLLVPLIVLQLVLMGVGLYDLTRPERRVRGGCCRRRSRDGAHSV